MASTSENWGARRAVLWQHDRNTFSYGRWMSPSDGTLLGPRALRLLADLESPDPVVRDIGAASQLTDLIDADAFTKEQLVALGHRLLELLAHDRIEARSFAALILSRVLRKSAYEEGWFECFRSWYSNEVDVTGFDPDRGWLHAVAHGADALAAFGYYAGVDPELVLEVAVTRMLHPGELVWRDQEDDRLGYAIAIALCNPRLTDEQARSWVQPIHDAFEAGEPGPVPPFASNTIRTLRMVWQLSDVDLEYAGQRMLHTHRNTSRAALLTVLSVVSPHMWTSESYREGGLR